MDVSSVVIVSCCELSKPLSFFLLTTDMGHRPNALRYYFQGFSASEVVFVNWKILNVLMLY